MIPAPLLDEINAAPDGRDTVAFFDMDGTLVSGFTAFAFALERMKRPAPTDIGVGAVALRYQLGRAEFVELLELPANDDSRFAPHGVEIDAEMSEPELVDGIYRARITADVTIPAATVPAIAAELERDREYELTHGLRR